MPCLRLSYPPGAIFHRWKSRREEREEGEEGQKRQKEIRMKHEASTVNLK